MGARLFHFTDLPRMTYNGPIVQIENKEISHSEHVAMSEPHTGAAPGGEHRPSQHAAIHYDDTGYVVDLDHLPRGYFFGKFFVGSFLAVGVGLSADTAAFGYPALILGYISNDIGPDANFPWIAYVYNVCLAVTLPILGQLTDTFGRCYFYVGGSVLGVIGAIICSRAQDIPTVIGGNVFLGLVSATQLSQCVILGELVLTRYRYQAVGSVYVSLVLAQALALSGQTYSSRIILPLVGEMHTTS